MAQRYWLGSVLSQCGRYADALHFTQQWLKERTRKTGEPPAQGGTVFVPPNPDVPKRIDDKELEFTSCAILYSAALASFRVFGNCEQSRLYLEMAAKSNPIILMKILAKVKRPRK